MRCPFEVDKLFLCTQADDGCAPLKEQRLQLHFVSPAFSRRQTARIAGLEKVSACSAFENEQTTETLIRHGGEVRDQHIARKRYVRVSYIMRRAACWLCTQKRVYLLLAKCSSALRARARFDVGMRM